MQFTIPDFLSKDAVFIPTNKNRNHWLFLVILPVARTVISIRINIRKQKNQSECGVLVLLNAFAITNNSLDIERETVSVKWRYWALDCCLKIIQKDLNSFNSTFNKKLLETVKHAYFLQNNEITKIQGEMNHDEFYQCKGRSLERKYLLNFGIPLMNIEYVFKRKL